jgi:tetratricopeptide (TPR) repeat protein
MEHVVVVGASLAGLRACETLRAEGFTGTVTLVGAEAEVPYDRPPLSKKLLAGEWDADRIRLRKPDDIAGLDLQMHLGVRATRLDTAARTVGLSDASTLTYDGLIIATGADVRRVPGWPTPDDLDGVCELRTLAAPSIGPDADRVWISCARTAFPADKPVELERFAFDTFSGSPPTQVIAAVAEAYAGTGPAGSEKAQALAKMAIDAAKDPSIRAAALVLQGRVLYQYGKLADSAKALAEAVSIAPNDSTALNNLAYLQITELGQVSEALKNARYTSFTATTASGAAASGAQVLPNADIAAAAIGPPYAAARELLTTAIAV